MRIERSSRATLAAIALLLMLVAADSSPAQEAEQGAEEEARNAVALFVGATDDDKEVAFTLGVDYERRLSRLWGIGALVDFAFGDLRSHVLGIPVFLHPTKRLKLLGAPGVEHREGEDYFLIRVGGVYGFDVGKVVLGPALFIDWTDDEETEGAYVFGLSVDFDF